MDRRMGKGVDQQGRSKSPPVAVETNIGYHEIPACHSQNEKRKLVDNSSLFGSP